MPEEPTSPKPPPPPELSIREKVNRDWEAIKPTIEANRIAKIEILQISLRLSDAERLYAEGRADSRYDWRYDLVNARFLHEGMLKWAEIQGEFHMAATNYWRELARRQWSTAYDYTLSGMNALLYFNAGVAAVCLGGLFSERAAAFHGMLRCGILGSFVGLVLCAVAIISTSEWLAHLSDWIGNKVITPPTAEALTEVQNYANDYHRKRGRWMSVLHYIAVGWFFFYVLLGIIILFFYSGG